MFGVAVKLVPNIAAVNLLRVLNRLRHSQPTVFYLSHTCSALNLQSSNQTSQPCFWRPSSMNLFMSKQYTHPHAFANTFEMSAKACWKLSLGLTAIVYVFRIGPIGVLAQ